jgi:hypothetical protein
VAPPHILKYAYSREIYLLLIYIQPSNIKLLASFIQDKRDVVYILAGTTAVVVTATAAIVTFRSSVRHQAELLKKDQEKEAALLKV